MTSSNFDEFVKEQLSLNPGYITSRSLASSKNIPQKEAAEVLERWWRTHDGELIHAYYDVFGRDHDDALVTVIRHADEMDAWISGNIKELGWKRMYGLSTSRLESVEMLVKFNRAFSMMIINPIVDIPITEHGKTANLVNDQSKKGNKLVQKEELKEHVEEAPDFSTELPEGVSAADFHQNLFKPLSITSKRKRMTKGQPKKGQATGISAMFQTKSQSESSPMDATLPSKIGQLSVEGNLQIDFTSEDESTPTAPIEDKDVKMDEPGERPKEHPKGMSKYFVVESTGESKTPGRRAKKGPSTPS